MRKNLIVAFFVIFASIVSATNVKVLKIGLRQKEKKQVSYGTLTFNSSDLLFEGRVIKKNGKALKRESFVEIPRKAIISMSLSGTYDNFLKLYFDKKSDFAQDNISLMSTGYREGEKVLYLDFVLYKKESIKKAYSLCKQVKETLIRGSGKINSEMSAKLKDNEILYKVDGEYTYKKRNILVIYKTSGYKGTLYFCKKRLYFIAKLPPKKLKKCKIKEYLDGNKLVISIPYQKNSFSYNKIDIYTEVGVNFNENSPFVKKYPKLLTNDNSNKGEKLVLFHLKVSDYDSERIKEFVQKI